DMTYFFYYMTNVMQEGIEILKNRVKTYMREDFALNKIQKEGLDLTPRQKLIIEILSNLNISFLQTSEEIAKRVKVSNRTVEEDLKYLIRFELVKIKKIGQHEFYSLNVEF
ncbi:MAG TPA: helix-turn-helix transcriptional regulator, partial [Campylobacterales bacterium]|nr:helix-turn-helix transcriptional regulator [Campylobacterales bacterium]